MMISQDVKVSFLFLILNGFFHLKTFVNDTILKCCYLIYFGCFNFFLFKISPSVICEPCFCGSYCVSFSVCS